MAYGYYQVFPAPAGVILVARCTESLSRRFPRTCGGDPALILPILLCPLFSPHLRG